jgi:phosphonate transport system ATP-binding protein
MSLPIIELRGVEKRFGSCVALRNINLRFEEHERVAVVGPSGAGKSTLLGILNGTLQPSAGEVLALGQPMNQLRTKERRRLQQQIGTVYQQFHLVPGLRVIHNVNAGRLARWSVFRAAVSLVWPIEVASARSALQRVGIPEKLFELTANLSGGQQQRVAIARVLVQDPRIILADEPISSLDPECGREIMDLLQDLAKQTAKTLITSIHSIQFASTHFQRVIGVRAGEVFFDRPSGDLNSETVDALYRIDRSSEQGFAA